MARPEEMRQFPRFRVSAWIECPALSDTPFPAEDISAGGFGAVLARKPREGHSYQVTLRVGDSVLFGPCEALLAWCQESAQRPGAWTFGMLTTMDDDQRDLLAAVLETLAEPVRA